ERLALSDPASAWPFGSSYPSRPATARQNILLDYTAYGTWRICRCTIFVRVHRKKFLQPSSAPRRPREPTRSHANEWRKAAEASIRNCQVVSPVLALFGMSAEPLFGKGLPSRDCFSATIPAYS